MATETNPQVGKPQVVVQLNLMVALSADLRSQVKQAHWNVVGENFIAIHKLLDELAATLLLQVDTYAERIRALQAVPRGTAREAAKNSPLKEFPLTELDEAEAIRAVLERYEQYSGALTEAIDTCDKSEDMTTQDVFIEAQRDVDLQAYFLRSHLGKSARTARPASKPAARPASKPARAASKPAVRPAKK